MAHRALVFAGGDELPASIASELPDDAFVVAADSGIDHAHALGLHVDLAVGDFDSVTPAGLARAEREGTRIERHPRDKDASDLALALDATRELGITRVTVVGGHGGRLDHLVGNLALLGASAYAALDLDARLGAATVTVVRDHAPLRGPVGSLVSLFAVHGPALGVTTRALRFPLRDARLEPGSTLGLSNEIAGTDPQVSLDEGVLLVVQPDPRSPNRPGGT